MRTFRTRRIECVSAVERLDHAEPFTLEIRAHETHQRPLVINTSTVAVDRILGACNPALAHRALEVDAAIGSLLPCNVVVRSHPQGGSEIIAADPNTMLGLADADIAPIAGEAAQRIQRAVQAAADK